VFLIYETLKKLIEYAISPPGIIIISFLIIFFIAKRKFVAYFSLICGILLYLLSISPVATFLVRPLELSYKVPHHIKADAIVVLGAGAYNANTLDGDSLNRLVTGFILYKKLNLPIIFSGGYATSTVSTANIAKNLLEKMGVKKDDIYIDNKSFDTNQNAQYTKLICQKYGFKTIVLVTSAYHMKRAAMLFKTAGLKIIPYPTDFKESYKYNFYSFLPSLGNLMISTESLREYLGYFYQSTVKRLY
jgi:uncharacterized SAM-binding protein YcdF (DUF218 family)